MADNTKLESQRVSEKSAEKNPMMHEQCDQPKTSSRCSKNQNVVEDVVEALSSKPSPGNVAENAPTEEKMDCREKSPESSASVQAEQESSTKCEESKESGEIAPIEQDSTDEDCLIVSVSDPAPEKDTLKTSPAVQPYVGGIRAPGQAAPTPADARSSLVTPCVVNLGPPVSSPSYISPPPPAPAPALVPSTSQPSSSAKPEALQVTNEFETTDATGRKVKVVTVSRDQFHKVKQTMEKVDNDQELQLTPTGELVYRPSQPQQPPPPPQLRSPTRQILPKPAPTAPVAPVAPPVNSAPLGNSPPAMLLANPTPVNILTLSPQAAQGGVIAPVYAPQLSVGASHVQVVSGPLPMAPPQQMTFVTPTGETQQMAFVATENPQPQVSMVPENTQQHQLSILTENPHQQQISMLAENPQQQQQISMLTENPHQQQVSMLAENPQQQRLNILTENPPQQQQQTHIIPLSLPLSGPLSIPASLAVTTATANVMPNPQTQTDLVASNLLRSLVTTGQIMAQSQVQQQQQQQHQHPSLNAASSTSTVSAPSTVTISVPAPSDSTGLAVKRKLQPITKAGPKRRKFMADTMRNQMIRLASQPKPANSNIRIAAPQGVKRETFNVAKVEHKIENKTDTSSSSSGIKKRLLQHQTMKSLNSTTAGIIKKRLFPHASGSSGASLVKKRSLLQQGAEGEKRKLAKLIEKKKQSGEIIRHAAKAHSEHHLVAHHQKSFLPEAAVEEEVIDSPSLATVTTETEPGDNRKCKTDKRRPYLVFEITSDDGFHVRAESCDAAWHAVTSRVSDARAVARLRAVAYPAGKGTGAGDGATMFGLRHPAILYLLEQLHGASSMRKHRFQYRDPPQRTRDDDDELEETPWGCMRAAPFTDRKPRDMFSFLLSRYRPRPKYRPTTDKDKNPSLQNVASKRATASSLPLAMRFRHLRSSAKEAVGVYYSNIHGRGLFCKREIDQGEMIIEYAGEVIRAALCDQREKYYESKHIGCYMFRVDDDDVVDATMMGNAARFINHSCDPNCYSKVINIGSKKHIVIFAQRPIRRGEELTYDYKFPIEEVKIPCTCQAKRCRKYLN